MAELGTINNIAADIAEDVAFWLDTATVGGVPVFTQVEIVNDAQSFIRVADPLSAPQSACVGIVTGTVQEAAARIDNQLSVCRLPLTIVIRFARNRNPGDGEADPMREAQRLAEIVKTSVLRDRTRGGRANLIVWNGAALNCTEVTGEIRPLTRFANEAFYAASITIACGWNVSQR